jgi:hypothetical protein
MRINGPIWPSPFGKLLVRLNPDTSTSPTITKSRPTCLGFVVPRSDQTVARPSDRAGDKGRMFASPRSAADGGNNGARA